jgi:hypothetical protein
VVGEVAGDGPQALRRGVAEIATPLGRRDDELSSGIRRTRAPLDESLRFEPVDRACKSTLGQRRALRQVRRLRRSAVQLRQAVGLREQQPAGGGAVHRACYREARVLVGDKAKIAIGLAALDAASAKAMGARRLGTAERLRGARPRGAGRRETAACAGGRAHRGPPASGVVNTGTLVRGLLCAVPLGGLHLGWGLGRYASSNACSRAVETGVQEARDKLGGRPKSVRPSTRGGRV